MTPITKRTSKDGTVTVTLPLTFANRTIVIEAVSAEELRIRHAGGSRRRYSLKQLVDGITPENLHEPVRTGAPVGGEVW